MHETALISSNYEFRMLQVREPLLFTNQRHMFFIVFYTNSITTNREFFSEFLVKQMRVGGIWEAAALLPSGPGAGPPLSGNRSSRGFSAKNFANFLQKSSYHPAAGRSGPGRPAAGRPEYISVIFQIENIFL